MPPRGKREFCGLCKWSLPHSPSECLRHLLAAGDAEGLRRWREEHR